MVRTERLFLCPHVFTTTDAGKNNHLTIIIANGLVENHFGGEGVNTPVSPFPHIYATDYSLEIITSILNCNNTIQLYF